jgi:hypothetical protein
MVNLISVGEGFAAAITMTMIKKVTVSMGDGMRWDNDGDRSSKVKGVLKELGEEKMWNCFCY